MADEFLVEGLLHVGGVLEHVMQIREEDRGSVLVRRHRVRARRVAEDVEERREGAIRDRLRSEQHDLPGYSAGYM